MVNQIPQATQLQTTALPGQPVTLQTAMPGRNVTVQKRKDFEIFPSNPFYGCLRVYSDRYQGILPSFGIKKTDFFRVTQLFDDIKEGRTKIQINRDKHFHFFILNIFKKLMTREHGREFIQEILAKPTLSVVHIDPCHPLCYPSESTVLSLDSRIVSRIYFSSQERTLDIIIRKSNGFFGRADIPDFILLAHELVHTLYDSPQKKEHMKPSFNKRLVNKEEEVTILGGSNKFSENSIRQAFGLPARVTHRWAEKRSNSVKVGGNQLTLEESNYFSQIISCGLYDELEAFLKENPDLGQKKTVHGFPSLYFALEIAAMFDDLKMFQLIESELNKNSKNLCVLYQEFYLAMACLKGHSYGVLKYILGLPNLTKQVHLQDSFGNNLLHILLSNFPKDQQNKKIAYEFVAQLKMAVDLKQKNLNGETPLDTAVKNDVPLDIVQFLMVDKPK